MPSEQNRLRAWVYRYAADNKTICSFTYVNTMKNQLGSKHSFAFWHGEISGQKNNKYITILLKPCNFRIGVRKLHLLQSLKEITETIPILAHILILLRSNIRKWPATDFHILFLTNSFTWQWISYNGWLTVSGMLTICCLFCSFLLSFYRGGSRVNSDCSKIESGACPPPPKHFTN